MIRTLILMLRQALFGPGWWVVIGDGRYPSLRGPFRTRLGARMAASYLTSIVGPSLPVKVERIWPGRRLSEDFIREPSRTSDLANPLEEGSWGKIT